MFSLTAGHRYWLWSRPTDMRKSFYSLSAIVSEQMKRDACNGDVYIFINKARNRIKLLHWEPGGLVLYSKILDEGRLGQPSMIGEDGSLQWRDLVMMVEGIVENPNSRRRRLEHLKSLKKE